jgi:hypothetical protein
MQGSKCIENYSDVRSETSSFDLGYILMNMVINNIIFRHPITLISHFHSLTSVYKCKQNFSFQIPVLITFKIHKILLKCCVCIYRRKWVSKSDGYKPLSSINVGNLINRWTTTSFSKSDLIDIVNFLITYKAICEMFNAGYSILYYTRKKTDTWRIRFVFIMNGVAGKWMGPLW